MVSRFVVDYQDQERNPLHLADLSRTADVAQTTLKRHLPILEALFMVRQLPAWSTNLTIVPYAANIHAMPVSSFSTSRIWLGVSIELVQSDRPPLLRGVRASRICCPVDESAKN